MCTWPPPVRRKKRYFELISIIILTTHLAEPMSGPAPSPLVVDLTHDQLNETMSVVLDRLNKQLGRVRVINLDQQAAPISTLSKSVGPQNRITPVQLVDIDLPVGERFKSKTNMSTWAGDKPPSNPMTSTNAFCEVFATLNHPRAREILPQLVKEFEYLTEHGKVLFWACSFEEGSTTGNPHLHAAFKFAAKHRRSKMVKDIPSLLGSDLQSRSQKASWTQTVDYFKYLDEDKTELNPFFRQGGSFPLVDGARSAGRSKGSETSQEMYAEAINFAEAGDFESLKKAQPGIYVKYFSTLEKISQLKQHEDMDVLGGLWIVGDSGLGKSRLVREYARARGWSVAIKGADNIWFPVNAGTAQMICLDDADHSTAKLSNLIKTIGDHYPAQVQVKGGLMMIRPEVVVITSNLRIEQIFFDLEADIKPIKRRYREVTIAKRSDGPHLVELDGSSSLFTTLWMEPVVSSRRSKTDSEQNETSQITTTKTLPTRSTPTDSPIPTSGCARDALCSTAGEHVCSSPTTSRGLTHPPEHSLSRVSSTPASSPACSKLLDHARPEAVPNAPKKVRVTIDEAESSSDNESSCTSVGSLTQVIKQQDEFLQSAQFQALEEDTLFGSTPSSGRSSPTILNTPTDQSTWSSTRTDQPSKSASVLHALSETMISSTPPKEICPVWARKEAAHKRSQRPKTPGPLSAQNRSRSMAQASQMFSDAYNGYGDF